MIFRGSMTAIVTPFKDGRVDEEALRSLVAWQIASGTKAIVPCGTTGEAATLDEGERDRVIRIAVEEAAGRVPVLAGAGSNSTAQAVGQAKRAKAAGADATLQVTPYYNKPPQEGLYRHFQAIAEMVDLPMVLYNVPGRTAVNMLPETTLRLASIPNVVGIKEASGDLDQIKRIIREVPPHFSVFSGDDAMNFDIYAAGGKGCISVVSNVAPGRVAEVWNAFSDGHTSDARRLHGELEALCRAMFIETNPIPAKTALAMMGRCREEFRLPLTPMAEGPKAKLHEVLERYEMLR